ncbi:MAG: 30S ribosomal protein S15 [Fidelibacterota bacterium]
MPLSKEKIQEIVEQFGQDNKDTGSPEVQIALLTQRIRDLTQHVKINKKDHHSRRGLVMLVAKRRKLLKYLRRINPNAYVSLIKKLKIRG